MSSVYHGLHKNMGKKVMQVIDHCTIYYLIGGTYTVILLAGVRRIHPGWAWTMFGIVWGLSIMAAVFTAIDHNKYQRLSMICYIAIGWCIVIAAKPTIEAVGWPAILWVLGGGISYTIGAVLYAIGKKRGKRYMHSVFHLFVVAGSVLQFFGIFFCVL
jgi:hemolysin III